MHAHGYFLCMVCIESEYTLFCQDLRSATLFAYLLYEFFSKEKGQRYSMVFIGTFLLRKGYESCLTAPSAPVGPERLWEYEYLYEKKIYI